MPHATTGKRRTRLNPIVAPVFFLITNHDRSRADFNDLKTKPRYCKGDGGVFGANSYR